MCGNGALEVGLGKLIVSGISCQIAERGESLPVVLVQFQNVVKRLPRGILLPHLPQ